MIAPEYVDRISTLARAAGHFGVTVRSPVSVAIAGSIFDGLRDVRISFSARDTSIIEDLVGARRSEIARFDSKRVVGLVKAFWNVPPGWNDILAAGITTLQSPELMSGLSSFADPFVRGNIASSLGPRGKALLDAFGCLASDSVIVLTLGPPSNIFFFGPGDAIHHLVRTAFAHCHHSESLIRSGKHPLVPLDTELQLIERRWRYRPRPC
jgi:hypothetical protein